MSLFNNNNNNSPIGGDFAIRSNPISAVSMNSVMRLVYVWMTLGLAITAVLALVISNQINTVIVEAQAAAQAANGAAAQAAYASVLADSIWLNPGVSIGLLIGYFVIAVALSFGLRRQWMSPTMAIVLFMVFAGVTGAMLAPSIWYYGEASVYKAFATTAVLFGVMSVYGYTTKSDLMSWGKYLMMALIGLIVAVVINMFLRSTALEFAISIFGVFLFTALTAYDTQQIKLMAEDPAIQNDSNALLKVSILGAFKLYLDFVNLFMYLLRLFGSSRD